MIQEAASTRDRAIRLFRFLEAVEALTTRPVRDLGDYCNGSPPGDVIWFGGAPDEPEVRSVLTGTLPVHGRELLTVERPVWPDPPEVPAKIGPHVLDAHSADPNEPPSLRPRDSGIPPFPEELTVAFERYLHDWREWVEEVNRVRPVRQLYRSLFQAFERLEQYPEQLECVIGAGCLVWRPDGHPGVRRHLLTMPATLEFEDSSGLMKVTVPETRDISVELDMLDPRSRPRPNLVEDVDDRLGRVLTAVVALDPPRGDEDLLEEEPLRPVLQALAHGLADDSRFDDTTAPPAPAYGGTPLVTFSPAVVVRRRSTERKLRMLREIVEQLTDESRDVPEGVASIVEPMDLHDDASEQDEGVAELLESYLPLPANDEQRRIVRSVERRLHTVVQGPPGTGKTHTIANVLAHLLATGRRVLITAHTERALKEVRNKLPAELQDLVIALTGQGRDERAALERSVSEMTSFVEDYDPDVAQTEIDDLKDELDQLRRRESELWTDLVESREAESDTISIVGYEGTPAEVARQLTAEAETYGWLKDTEVPPEPPVDVGEARRLLGLLRHQELNERTDEIDQPLPDLRALPAPAEFVEDVTSLREAVEAAKATEHLREHVAHAAIVGVEASIRHGLASDLRSAAVGLRPLVARSERWVADLLDAAAASKLEIWEGRLSALDDLLPRVDRLRSELGRTPVRVSESIHLDALVGAARGLRRFLADGGRIRRPLPRRPVREAAAVLEHVTVDGEPPDEVERLDAFLTWAELHRLIEQAERSWPTDAEIPDEDTPGERIGWLGAETKLLRKALHTGRLLSDLHHRLADLGVKLPNWRDPQELAHLADVFFEPDARQAAEDARQPLHRLLPRLKTGPEAPERRRLADAAERLDVDAYRNVYQEIGHLRSLRENRDERNQLLGRLSEVLPQLTNELQRSPDNLQWDGRLASLPAACRWAHARAHLRALLDADRFDRLLEELDRTDRQLQQRTLELTVALGWQQATERLGPRQRRRLKTYALLAGKLPKGGKYRARKLREVQEALRRCRDAVPAWVMPISYVAEVLDADPEAFDVVIVDEASQAGMDAVFLQYLAPKMIVIGDDLQVSPTSFLDREELYRLVAEFLDDFEDKATWVEPESSLFDHAKVRFGQTITLREHFRCMPEIIGYSMQHVYERHGVKLVPLRQYGADRLPPIRTVHVRDGYRQGKQNIPEAETVVEAIAKCCVDPAYEYVDRDGVRRKRTIGVISLIGDEQAKRIEQMLLDEIGEREYAERQVRCGSAADFQGSQRDVVFLSMVEAGRPDGSRIPAQTQKSDMQRLNVAASRARDQQWLFHSVLPQELNPRDLRHQLLTYCRTVNDRFGSEDHAVPVPVPEDRLVERFDSLFEQRVFNRIVRRGYAVETQREVNGYRIDLIVIGRESQLAVECDGDHWHGPEQYEADLTRQRELERAEWTFFRLRESEFYADMSAALQPLWDTLERLGIHPVVVDRPPTTNGPNGPPLAPSPDEPSFQRPTPPVKPEPAALGSASVAEPPTQRRQSDPVEGREVHSQAPPKPDMGQKQLPRPEGPEVEGPNLPELQAYAEWSPTLDEHVLRSLSPTDLASMIPEAVAKEGPVTIPRLARVLTADPARVENACAIAVARTLLHRVDDQTVIKPDQKAAPRMLGPRSLREVPAIELRAWGVPGADPDVVAAHLGVDDPTQQDLAHIHAAMEGGRWLSRNR